MVKQKNNMFIVSIVCILIIALIFSGCLEENNKEEEKNGGDKTYKKGVNLLKDPGFEDIKSIVQETWGMAGYTTTNHTYIYYNNEFQGAKIENNTFIFHNGIKYNGSMSAYIKGVDIYNESVISNWNQKIIDTSIIPYGEDLILSCWIKTVDAGDVILMIQCWNSTEINFKNLIKYQSSTSYGKINGTIIWEKYSIKLVDVPGETKAITVRLGLTGTGEVWFDDVELYSIS